MKHVDLVIVGGGSAGMAAAVSAYDAGVQDILLLERSPYLGGILNQCIHNGFGLHEFKEELTGPEFLTRFVHQVEERHIHYETKASVLSIKKSKIVTYVSPKGSFEVQAKAIVVATGCYERSAGAISMPGERPAGVITAGQAQLYLNQYGYLVGKRVFILGSGDIGLIMARRMTLEGAKVLGVAELMPYSNGLNRNIQQCLKDFDIPLYLSHTVTNVIGKGKLEAIEISQVDEKKNPIPGTEKRFEVDTLMLSIGLIPNCALLDKAGAKIGPARGAEVDDALMTSIPGIFTCGNVLHVHDLVDYVVEEGKVAGKNAAAYILGTLEEGAKVPTKAGNGIGYVVPGSVALGEEGGVSLKFRCRAPSKNVYLIVKQGEKVIKKLYKLAMIPSEMEIIKIPRKALENSQEPLEVSLVAKEDAAHVR
ncbi:MAG: FAD-dependent oxidoreductase [Bacillales bacterium]|nr:FAD-dependent oxidoreductase [Bacillales bacterium]MDY5920489.1 FAD-dependent oxidoreductase [Candidatus Enteromonas sp.]